MQQEISRYYDLYYSNKNVPSYIRTHMETLFDLHKIASMSNYHNFNNLYNESNRLLLLQCEKLRALFNEIEPSCIDTYIPDNNKEDKDDPDYVYDDKYDVAMD